MIFQILGLLVLSLFYGIYLGKMFMQRRRGIQTDHIAKGRKQGKLFWVEIIMKIATYAVLAAEVISLLSGVSRLPDLLRYMGVFTAFAGVACFGVSVYTMRDSWRAGIPENDKTEIVTTGIYSISRNPAFVGFDLLYTGLLLMFLNPFLLVFSVFAMVMLHMQILQEEKFMENTFGKAYCEYRDHVCRYLGRK